MRTEKEVRRRLQQRRYRHQKRYLEAMLGRTHANCRFNAQAEAAHGVGGGVCTHPDLVKREMADVPLNALIAKRPRVTLPVCDAGPMRDKAKKCGKFESRVSKDRAKHDFKRILAEASRDMDKFAAMWPDMAQLIWVLNPGATEAPPEVVQDAEPPDEENWDEDIDEPAREDLELRAMPGAHLQIGEPSKPVTTATVPLEHAGYVGESTKELAPLKPTPQPKPGRIARFLRWLLSMVEGDG